MGQIRWTQKAASNLEAIHTYIAQDSETYATRFIKSLIATTEKLEKLPGIGRIVPELKEYGFRELIYRNYHIVYQVTQSGEDIEILAVVHGARRIDNLFHED